MVRKYIFWNACYYQVVVCLVIFYISFMSKPDKRFYKWTLNRIWSHQENETSDEIKVYIKAHQNVLKTKKLTKARKERIFGKLIVKQKIAHLYVSIYSSALQVMRRSVKIFRQAEPAASRIHVVQVDVFTEFLINFIKPEVLSGNNCMG